MEHVRERRVSGRLAGSVAWLGGVRGKPEALAEELGDVCGWGECGSQGLKQAQCDVGGAALEGCSVCQWVGSLPASGVRGELVCGGWGGS